MSKRFLSVAAILSVLCLSVVAAADTSVRGVLRSGAAKEYNVVSRPGNQIILAVMGDGDGDLDCWLLDPDGEVVAKDNDNQDNCAIVLRSQERQYTLRIRNNGRAATAYTVAINDGTSGSGRSDL